jgi:WD40 repeat protein
LALSPDWKTLALSTHHENFIWLHDMETGELKATLRGHSNSVNSVVFSADGRLIVTGGCDGFVNIWNSQTHQILNSLVSEPGL